MRIKILLLILFITPISISSQQIISNNNKIDETINNGFQKPNLEFLFIGEFTLLME